MVGATGFEPMPKNNSCAVATCYATHASTDAHSEARILSRLSRSQGDRFSIL